jgi:hypothetical protein
MDEQRRLIEEMMGGHQREERGDLREFDAIYDGRDHDDDDDDDDHRPRRQREFDADAIYGGRDDDDGRYRSDDDGGNYGEYGYVEEGWGPPLANLNVGGLPRSPASKQVVKSTLKQLFTRAVASRDSGGGGGGGGGQHDDGDDEDAVVSVTWGQKGHVFVAMRTPKLASQAILALQGTFASFPGFGRKQLDVSLDENQGLEEPALDDDDDDDHYDDERRNGSGGGSRDYGNGGACGDDERGGGAGAGAAEEMVLSFTSREGRMREEKERVAERKQREDQRRGLWCPKCGSRDHAVDQCPSDFKQYHQRVVSGVSE